MFMSVKLLVFLSVFLAAFHCQAQQDSLEWAKWGIPDSFHMEFQRLARDTTVLQGTFLAYYKDHVIIKGQFNESRKSGHWQHFSLYTDTLRAEGSFENGVPVGEWRHYHLNGVLKSVKQFTNGSKKGEQLSFYKTGKERFKALYRNSAQITELTAFYPSGDTALKRTFDFTIEPFKGTHISYYNRGPVFETYTFEIDPGHPNLLQLLKENFSLEKHIYLNTSGMKQRYPAPYMYFDGSYRKSHYSGYRWEHFVYSKGKIINVLQGLNQWGSPQQQLFDEADNRFTLIRYQSTGDTLSIESYVDGALNGQSAYYESLNRKTWSGEFSQGMPVGEWKRYDLNLFPYQSVFFFNADSLRIRTVRKEGILEMEQFIANNHLQGTSTLYDYYGEVDRVIHYVDGVPDGKYIEYRKERPLKAGMYQYGIKKGVWETFNPRGKVTWSEEFEGIVCNETLAPISPFHISSIESSAYKYSPVFLPPELHTSFQTPFVQNIDGKPYSIRMSTGLNFGDVVFNVTVEDTGHVVRIECIGAGKEAYYQIALSILQQMPFMFPAYIEGMPETTECLISFNFNRL